VVAGRRKLNAKCDAGNGNQVKPSRFVFMKIQNPVPVLAYLVLSVLGLAGVPSARADWLALDGQNTIWRLADTNGADATQFAYLNPYHEEWFALALGPAGNVSAVRRGDTSGNGIDIFSPNGAGVGSITVGPYINGKMYVPGSLTTGPDGNIYIADNYWKLIARYSGTNGAYAGTFVSDVSVNGLTFGPDGNLYVADANRGVVRYDGTNGAYLDTFVPVGTNGVPDTATLTFGPDGNLYVASAISNAVFRFDGSTGQFMDDFVPTGSGGLSSLNGLVFGPDGNLYVSDTSGTILRYDGQTGAFLDVFGFHARYGLVYLPFTASFAASPASGSAPLTVQFTDLSNDATNWDWNFGDGSADASAQNPSHTYETAGNFAVTLTATGSNGATSSRSGTITVTSPPSPPVTADFSYNPASGAAPLPVQFTDKSAGSIASWDWNFGDDSADSTAQNPSHTYVTVGNFVVSLTATGTDGSTSKTQTVTVTNAPPPPPVTVTATQPWATSLTPGVFTISRNNTGSPLLIVYSLGGTAQNGVDYQTLSGSAMIPAGAISATVTVRPLGLLNALKTVVLTISPDASYSVGSPASATVTIVASPALPPLMASPF
jgi:PKD repeat protein